MPRQRSQYSASSFIKSSYARRLWAEQLEDRRVLSITVDTLADVVDANDGLTSLREAITTTNAGSDSEIDFSVAGTINLDAVLGELEIADTLTIDGNNQITIDAQQNSRVLNFTATSGDLTLAGLTVTGGQTTGDGGGIRFNTDFNSQGTLTLTSSTVHGNISDGNGGGIFAVRGDVLLTNSTISGNISESFGGGIHSSIGSVSLTDSTVSGNTSANFGGGIYSPDGEVSLTNSAVNGNSSRFYGGGISTNLGDVSLTNSTISGNSTTSNGGGGGGIRTVEGDVSLTSSTVSGNTSNGNAGGIFTTYGNLALTSSVVSGNIGGFAGGIFTSEGDVALTSSTVSGNTSNDGGGGIRTIDGDVSLTGSTVSGNTATGSGGGVFSQAGPVTLINSTVSGNITTGSGAAGGGIYSFLGPVRLTSSTVSGNEAGWMGGGLFVADTVVNPTLTVDNSIIAGNTDDGSAPDLRPNALVTPSIDHSLIGDTTGLTQPQQDALTNGIGNLQDVDPLLGPLAENGGPTQTHALLAGSPAIGAGDDSVGAITDQRGAPFVRNLGGVDIGAYERQTVANLNLVVDTPTDENDGGYFDGGLSLREAIGLANGSIGADTITFDPMVFTGGAVNRIQLGGTELEITDTLTIDGPGQDLLSIDAQQASRVLNFSATSGDLTIAGLTLTGGQTTGDGGGILFNADDNLNLLLSTVSGNTSGNDGGGVSTRNGSVSLTSSTVSGNTSTYGGGIRTSRGSVSLIDSTVSGNTARSRGGGIQTYRGSVSLASSTVSENTSGGVGGGIRTNSGAVSVANSTVTNNHANGAGGGFYVSNTSFNASFTVENTIIAGNTDDGTAPDLRPDPDSTLTINHSLIGVADGLGTITGNTGNLTGTAATPVDPLLAPLADNGGPTPTHALLAGSPAIDAGDPSTVPNFSFEANGGSLENWTLVNSGGVVNSPAFDGGTSATLGDDPQGFSVLVQGVEVQPGAEVSASVQWRIANPLPAGAFGELKLEFYPVFGADFNDRLGETIVLTADGNSPLNKWRLTEAFATAPAGSVEARLVLTYVGADPAGTIFYDAVTVQGASDTTRFDQRGPGFDRLADGGGGRRIDLGAFEAQATPPLLPGDYNLDGDVDAADYTVWRDSLGDTTDFYAGADGNGDGVVDRGDFETWRNHFGQTVNPTTLIDANTRNGEFSILTPNTGASSIDLSRGRVLLASAAIGATVTIPGWEIERVNYQGGNSAFGFDGLSPVGSDGTSSPVDPVAFVNNDMVKLRSADPISFSFAAGDEVQLLYRLGSDNPVGEALAMLVFDRGLPSESTVPFDPIQVSTAGLIVPGNETVVAPSTATTVSVEFTLGRSNPGGPPVQRTQLDSIQLRVLPSAGSSVALVNGGAITSKVAMAAPSASLERCQPVFATQPIAASALEESIRRVELNDAGFALLAADQAPRPTVSTATAVSARPVAAAADDGLLLHALAWGNEPSEHEFTFNRFAESESESEDDDREEALALAIEAFE